MDTAFTTWREQILAFDRDVAEIRGGEHEDGHARPVFASQPLDPYRTDDPALNTLYKLFGEGAEILDVGGGAGRFAVPLATRAKSVTVIDPSDRSLELLNARAAEFGLTNITAFNERWEDAEVPAADMALCSLVLHHVLEAVPFVRKLEESARERVVVLEMMETPGSVERPFHERVYGKAPTPLPGLPRLLELLWSMAIYPDVTMLPPQTPVLAADRNSALENLRRRLVVVEDTEQDVRLRTAAEELLEESSEGLTVRGVDMWRPALVTWRPIHNGS